MSKVAVMMSENRAQGQMSSHFGKAEWIMIADTENSVPTFQKNEALNGHSAAEIVSRQGCTDVIFTEIGYGALGHLKTAGIRGWAAPKLLTGEQAIQMFKQAQLQAVSQATENGAVHGCCCANRARSEASSCCRG